MRAISGRNASCRATSLPIPALAPVINTVFPGSVLIGIPSHVWRPRFAVCRVCGSGHPESPAKTGLSNPFGASLTTMTVTQTRTGRPLTSRGQATRDRIVAAAAAEIYARGVTATTLEHIKAKAEVSSSQLYHYFKDKDALVLAVIEHQAQAVLAGTEPEHSHLDSVEALRAW